MAISKGIKKRRASASKPSIKHDGSASAANAPKHRKSGESAGTATTGSSTDHNSLPPNATLLQRLMHKDRLLGVLAFSSVILGVMIGSVLKRTKSQCFWTPRRVTYLGFPGELFSNVLQCIKLPLIVSSIVAAVGSIDLKTFRIIGTRYILFVAFNLTLSTITGTLLARALGVKWSKKGARCSDMQCAQPKCVFWNRTDYNYETYDSQCTYGTDYVMDFVRSFFPANIIQSYMQTEKTSPDLTKHDDHYLLYSGCNEYINRPDREYRPTVDKFYVKREWIQESNYHGIYSVCIVAGVCVILVGERGRPFLNAVISLSETCLQMATWLIWASPIGITFLVAGNIVENESLTSTTPSILYFGAACCASFVIHSFITLPLIYTLFTRKLPFKFFGSIVPALISGFGISSSFGTIPITISTLEGSANMDPRVVRFLIPMGPVLNSSGSSMLVAASVKFLILKHVGSQPFLTTVNMALKSLMLTYSASSTFTASQSAVNVVATILGLYNIFPSLASELLPLVWITARLATVTSLIGDCVCVAVINHISRHELRSILEEEEQARLGMEMARENERRKAAEERQKLKEKQIATATETIFYEDNKTIKEK